MGKHLPFYKRFHDPIRRREKRFTLRNERYGEPGEVIPSDVGPLLILSVRQETPAWVRDNLFRDEGCKSPADFFGTLPEDVPKAASQIQAIKGGVLNKALPEDLYGQFEKLTKVVPPPLGV